MSRKSAFTDYEPFAPKRNAAASDSPEIGRDQKFRNQSNMRPERQEFRDKPLPLGTKDVASARNDSHKEVESAVQKETSLLKRGHALTYAALFLFTVILYARPAEFYPSPFTASIAFIVGIITLVIFVPSQLAIDGTLTARPREVNLVLLLCLAGLLSIPLAINPGEAWGTFTDTFIRCVVIFLVMVNVVRTEARLKGLLFLAIIASIWLSIGAINDYRLGLATVEGYRVAGRGSGIFGNANDMALHLVTIIPIVAALFSGTHSPFPKILFGACALLMIAGVVLTYSRGGFIGLIVALIFLALKIGRQKRLAIVVCSLIVITGFFALAPGEYGTRVLSIFVPSLDRMGSSDSRRAVLYRSIWTAIRHPLLGIGMGNFHNVSFREQVSHNAYTQVAAEMGMAALVVYTMFIVTPLRRLGQIAGESFATRSNSRYYYLSVGLQASLLAYMVTSFFASVAYIWYVYYLVAYAVCLRRLYEAETGKEVVLEKQRLQEGRPGTGQIASLAGSES